MFFRSFVPHSGFVRICDHPLADYIHCPLHRYCFVHRSIKKYRAKIMKFQIMLFPPSYCYLL